MSKKTAKIQAEKYIEVDKVLYPQIQEEFEKIETGKSFSKTDVRMIHFSDKVDKTLRILKAIDTSELHEIVDEKIIEIIEHNINFIYDDLLYIQRRLLGYEFADDLKVPVSKYLKSVAGDDSNYKKWAKHPDELLHKFIEMLTHPDNVETYRNQIKRMALGTMSQKEFNKIFQATKHKMIELHKPKLGDPEKTSAKFESFSEYKTYNYEA